jgi:hypothetical protein
MTIGNPPTTTSSSSVDSSRISFSLIKFKFTKGPPFAEQPPLSAHLNRSDFHANWQEKNAPKSVILWLTDDLFAINTTKN